MSSPGLGGGGSEAENHEEANHKAGTDDPAGLLSKLDHHTAPSRDGCMQCLSLYCLPTAFG